jgi:hypothetical protein
MEALMPHGRRSKAEEVIEYLVRGEDSLLHRFQGSTNNDRMHLCAVTFDNRVAAIPVRSLNQATPSDFDLRLTQVHGQSTAIGLALDEGFKMVRDWIQAADPNIPRFATMLLLTDGQNNTGKDPRVVADEIKAWAAAHVGELPRLPILIATAPFGTDADAGMLEAIASPNPKDGNPMCKAVTSGAELRDFFMASIRAAAPGGVA